MAADRRDLESAGARMRRDWDNRAAHDALRYVYTRDRDTDEEDFAASGWANYDQLVRPFLPILLDGRAASGCTVLEIGCGVGRMTACFADEFGEVHALDVSPAMLAKARERLAGYPNVRLHQGSGYDLGFLADASVDLAFSYIVFQHVPSRAVIENYVREAARVLAPGGAFKFQLNGDQSPEYAGHVRDTWLGETFSAEEAHGMLRKAGFALLASEGHGTQYFVLCARKKAAAEAERDVRSYILPGEPWAERQLLAGWGAPVECSWRPVESHCEALLTASGPTFFLGLYFWPAEPFPQRRISVFVDGQEIGSSVVRIPGDHYFELAARPCADRTVRVSLRIEPPCGRPPAVRSLGFYTPR